MRLSAEDYEHLIKKETSKLTPFARPDGTSLSYNFMRQSCYRLIEITNEYNLEYPKEYRKDFGSSGAG